MRVVKEEKERRNRKIKEMGGSQSLNERKKAIKRDRKKRVCIEKKVKCTGR